jgi:hypothetical protein
LYAPSPIPDPLALLNNLSCTGIIFLSLIFSMIVYRRRRAARANLAFTQQNQQGGYGGQVPYQPQYPPQAYGGAAGVHPHSYDPNAGFAPVRPTRSLFHFLITDVNSYSLARWLAAAVLPASEWRASGRPRQNAVSRLMEVLYREGRTDMPRRFNSCAGCCALHTDLYLL